MNRYWLYNKFKIVLSIVLTQVHDNNPIIEPKRCKCRLHLEGPIEPVNVHVLSFVLYVHFLVESWLHQKAIHTPAMHMHWPCTEDFCKRVRLGYIGW